MLCSYPFGRAQTSPLCLSIGLSCGRTPGNSIENDAILGNNGTAARRSPIDASDRGLTGPHCVRARLRRVVDVVIGIVRSTLENWVILCPSSLSGSIPVYPRRLFNRAIHRVIRNKREQIFPLMMEKRTTKRFITFNVTRMRRILLRGVLSSYFICAILCSFHCTRRPLVLEIRVRITSRAWLTSPCCT